MGPTPALPENRTRAALLLAAGLVAVLLVFAWLSVRTGVAGEYGAGALWRGTLAAFGWGAPLPEGQMILELRLWRTIVAVGVGAALAFSGGVLQGVFRNGLASPSVLGVTTGSTLGAYLGTLALGGYLPLALPDGGGLLTPTVVTLSAFAGALGTGGLVMWLGSSGGRISVPSLLLIGIAVNTCIGGILAVIQSLAMDDFGLTRAFLAWSFGTLDDRSPQQAAMVWLGLLPAAATIPFLAFELDLFAGGEDDARSLGVATRRLKALALLAASLSAAAAVAVAGQIAFVGLIVPHLVRLGIGSSHRRVLPLSLLAGAVFLLGTDVLQRLAFGYRGLEPGVLMSLFGGPFFLLLLLRNRRAVESW